MTRNREPLQKGDGLLIELVDDSASGRRSFGGAFRRWTGPNADVQVLFTPDVLMAFSSDAKRGYLYDDGWSVECWIERGTSDFMQCIEIEFGRTWADAVSVTCPQEIDTMSGLLDLAFRHGHPIAEVQHLI